MRPIRDGMGVAGGVNNLPWLFTGTLIGMLLVNLPFAWLVKTLPRDRFILLAYRFFAANIVLFAIALYLADPAQTIYIGRFFLFWVSVNNLLVLSLLCKMHDDLSSSDQGKCMFCYHAHCGSVSTPV